MCVCFCLFVENLITHGEETEREREGGGGGEEEGGRGGQADRLTETGRERG